MIKYIFYLIIFLMFHCKMMAQWYSQSISDPGYFGVVHFENDNVGWMVSNNPSRIYRTTNGGDNWSLQYQPVGPIISIFFLDGNNGWFAEMGANGSKLFYTSNGGTNWMQRYPATGTYFHNLHFFDVSNGIGVGSTSPSPGFPQGQYSKQVTEV